MRTILGMVVVMITVGAVAPVRAEMITFSSHVASGHGTANVFDGGPVMSHSGSTYDPMDPDMAFIASDSTQPGSYGAHAAAAGRSEILFNDEEMSMILRVEFTARYGGSLFPGGDNPGGMAEGELSSVIEFVIPEQTLIWGYRLLITDTIDFDGSTNIVLENVTQSQTLLSLTGEAQDNNADPLGSPGDLIRITTLMSGSGVTAGGLRRYDTDFVAQFVIPEPTSALLFGAGSLLLPRRRWWVERRVPPPTGSATSTTPTTR